VKVVVLDDWQGAVANLACLTLLEGHELTILGDREREPEEVERVLREVEALVPIRERTAVTAAFLGGLPRLRLIAQTGRGTAHVDLAACARRGVAVSAGEGSPVAPAELTFGLILAALRNIPHEAAGLRSGRWQETMGTALHGRTLGILGYGAIGALVASYGAAFGMRVAVWGREGSRSRALADGHAVATDREALCSDADVLSLHLKLTAETRGLVTASDLARMKPTALLVNTARAELIEPGALARALRAGRPGLAAVDVFEREPASPGEEPLLGLDNALCTPHLGFVERDTYERYFGDAFARVAAFAAGEGIPVLAPEALESR
jgi:D-3-phosphoglycerate dehydrogenase